MNNLDDFLRTPDELFNTNVQFWYFEFKGVKKPNTKKPFEVYAKALHEVYFFILDNLNKPFGCIEKVKEVLSTSDFNHTEKLILVNKLLGVLYHHPEQEKTQMVYLQLTDFSNDLSPYLNDPAIKNHTWHFDFEAIKTKFASIATPLERHKFLTNLYYDYKAQRPGISELERHYYKDIGFFEWIKAELSRCKYELDLERATRLKNDAPQPGTVEGKPEQEQKTTQSENEIRIGKEVYERFKHIDEQHWQYAFLSENDYVLFTDLLVNYLSDKPYTLPETVIQLKKNCKTKVAKVLGEIHRELSNNKLNNDDEYFRIIKTLNHFEKITQNDLYKALTR